MLNHLTDIEGIMVSNSVKSRVIGPGFITLILLTISFTIDAAEVEFSMYYSAPETKGEWVFMLEMKNHSGTKLKPESISWVSKKAEISALNRCKQDPSWYDDEKLEHGLFSGESRLAKYVSVPLANKQPDQIRIVFFNDEEAVFDCPKPAKDSACPKGQVCLW
jgi:hypothetical protein